MIANDDLPDPRLAELLAQAPKSIAPGRDLWPGIAPRLRRRGGEAARRRVWVGLGALAAAAALVLMLRTGPLTGDPTAREAAESAEMQQVLNATTGARSATAKSLAHYLAILDGAISETEAALHETPGDPALTDFLRTLQRRRLTLLTQAAHFAAES